MGQTLGRAPLPKGCERFVNLPRTCVYDLWDAFNDIAEGFGLSIEEFQEILKSALLEHIGGTERELNMDTDKVFRMFDNDENNLVDSLEFLSAFAMLSGMTPDEKIRFIFAMYDFDESSVLTLDEMVLAFRSTLSGLAKLSKIDPPTETEVENIVVQAFENIRKANEESGKDENFDGSEGIEKEPFLSFCLNTPEIISWIEFFDDLEEYQREFDNMQAIPPPAASHIDRSNYEDASMNVTLGGFEKFRIEKQGTAKDLLSRQPWENVVPFVSPARLPDQVREAPAQNFDMEWIFGWNSHCSRQSLYYSAKGSLIYAAGATCIVSNLQSGIQTFFNLHTDMVTCLKVFFAEQGDTVVASGECGLHPAIHVWDSESKELLSTLKGFHKLGIAQLDFSPDRRLLCSLGMDLYNSIAVYSWKDRRRLWASRTTADKVYDIRFLENNLIGSCGKNHVYFWRKDLTNTFKRFRGLFGTAVKEETLLTIAAVGNTIVTGSETGMLHVWEGRNWISSIRGHSGRVNAMFVVDQGEEKGLISACTAGKIQVWNSKLEIGATFNANSLGAIEPTICAITWDLVTSKILIGFKSCEMFEMDSTDGRNIHKGSVVAGHFAPKLSAIATHPLTPTYFCTAGKEKTVRVFDSSQHCQVKMAMLDTMANCCTYSPDGQVILIGYGCGIEGCEERKEGGFVALNEEDLTIVHEARDSKGMITDCKYTPDGKNFILASLDGALYVYQASNYAAKAKCRGHSGKAIHFDISNDNQFIMSNSSTGEVLFWDVERGEQQAPKLMKEVQWDSNCCVYSYGTQGIWSVYDDKTYCTSVARSNSREIICVTDNYGKIRVFNYPCVNEDPNYVLMRGHAASIERCKFSTNDGMLFTTGGTDGSIIQWKVILPAVQDLEEMKKDDTNMIGYQTEVRFEGRALDRNDHHRKVEQDNPLAVCLMEEGTESAAAMQPWQRTIVAPSVVPPVDNSEPSDNLALEHVMGFSVERSRESLMYAKGEISFFTSNIAVIMDQKVKKQRFYMDHASTITAMSVHPTEPVVATGEQSELGTIKIWNSETLQTINVLDGFHRKGVCHLEFSPNGKMLATVGYDRFHSIAIFDWANGHIISYSPSFTVKSYNLKFHPNSLSLVHSGDECIRFYEFKGLNLTYQDALFSNRAKLQKFLCIGWIGGNSVVGTADGNLYRFIGRQLDGMVQAHVGPVNSIASSNDGICSAGTDGFVKIWSRILECRIMIDLKDLHALNTNARCISWDSDMGRALIGTMSSEIFEISTSDGENLHGGNLMEGHSGDELHGLSAHPTKDLYATVGDDAILHVWDVFKHVAVSSVPLEMPARCCAYAPDGRRIAVGFGTPIQNNAKAYDGKWVVLDTEDYQVTHEARDSTKWLTDMKFSPNGDFFAVGSTDNKIYVYSVLNGFALNAAITQHNAIILSVDFSDDSAWLQSNCAGMELYYFEADTGMFIPAASRLRDVVWSTQTCSMGWSVQGIWPAARDGTEITAVDCNLFRGSDGTTIASGDNFGRINLNRHPCTSSFSFSKKYRPSSSPVTRIRFVAGDSYVVTLSGKDKTIFQWAHYRDREGDVAWDVVDRGGAIDEDDEDVLGFFCLSGKDDVVDLNEFKSIIGTRPWVSAMIAPTVIPMIITDRPPYRLEKSHIFGVQAQTSRHSVRFNGNGDVVYPVSRYVSVYNKKTNSQTYYEGHVTELSCVGVSPDGKFAGSADRSNRPNIHIFDANTCENITILPLLHRRGVVSIQFSGDNKMMVSVGQDQDHTIALWESLSGEWYDGRLLAWNKGDNHPVLFCQFYNNESYLLASGGRFHQKFWSREGKSLNPSYAEYSNKQKLGTLLSGAAIDENTFISGSTTGNLFVWKGRKLEHVIRGHEMGVSGLWACKIGVVSTSKDGMIKLWSSIMGHMKSFSLTDADVPPLQSCIRSVDAGFSDDGSQITRILISTMSSEIYEISAKSGTLCLMQEAHFDGEVWGLGVHPTDPDIFATAGDDKTIRVWSISHKRIIRKAVLDCTARCINFSPDGRLLIVGLGGSWDGKRQRKDGAFIILDAKTLKPQFEGRDSRHWLMEVKFSPDGRVFAVGSMDHKIYIYNRNSYRLKGMCDRHNSYIKNFDFSEDSVYIQSDSGDYEHLYFEAEDGQYFASGSQLKDIRWDDWTCSFGWPVQGCWPYFDDVNSGKEAEPASIHRSPDKQLLGVGDLNGSVKLFNCPCTEKDAQRVQQIAHVKEVAQVRFSCDGKYIISVGKKDRSVITWKVKSEKLK